MENQNPPIPTQSILTEQQPNPLPIKPHNPLNWLKLLIGAVIVLLVIAGVGIGNFLLGSNKNTPVQTACTMEAKLCPDGSSVGRSGPKCEFSPCPSPTPDPTANWKTYTNTEFGFSFKYPDNYRVEDIPQSLKTLHTISVRSIGVEKPDSFSFNDVTKGAEIDVIPFTSDLIGGYRIATNQFDQKKIKTIDIDGRGALMINLKSLPTDRQGVQIYVPIAGGYLNISFMTGSEDTTVIQDSHLKEFNEFLPTFKFSDKKGPDDIVKELYDDHISCLQKHFQNFSGNSPEQDCPYEKTFLTSTLLQQLENTKSSDPILCSSNQPSVSTVDKAIVTNNTATTTVHTYYSNIDNPINLGLVLEDNNWKINSIACSH